MRIWTILPAALAITAVAGFAQNKGGGNGIPSPLMIMVSGYRDGGAIPAKYTCAVKPAGGSPMIEWSGAPSGTQSFALIFHDGDVHPGKLFDDVTHWIAWNIPASATSLSANQKPDAEMPDGMKQGVNIARKNGYMGPCPPPGLAHHYMLEMYALDSKLDIPATSNRDELENAMSGHVLASGVYIGTFHR